MARQTITFVLDTVRDRDILHWLEGQENKSAAIREAIRTHLGRSVISLVDVYGGDPGTEAWWLGGRPWGAGICHGRQRRAAGCRGGSGQPRPLMQER
jgi:hypothetical protein